MFTGLLALTGAITLNPEDIKCLAAAIDSYMESTGDMQDVRISNHTDSDTFHSHHDASIFATLGHIP